MKRKAFISFRYKDGNELKEELITLLEKKDLIIDKSESVDRSNISEESIESYLFEKLRDTSLTIVVITPLAVNYYRNHLGIIDDWLYDELRYSLYERKGNSLNAVVAVYTEEVKNSLLYASTKFCNDCNMEHTSSTIRNFYSLVRKNMMNVKKEYKKNKCTEFFDSEYDSYISLVPINDFKSNPEHYINIAYEKRSNANHYDLVKRI